MYARANYYVKTDGFETLSDACSFFLVFLFVYVCMHATSMHEQTIMLRQTDLRRCQMLVLFFGLGM
jgi:hypothetical protein